jgi:transcriptional regulator with XRE-family HTH domain
MPRTSRWAYPAARDAYTAERDARIIELKEAGWSQRKIAKEVGVSAPTVGVVLAVKFPPVAETLHEEAAHDDEDNNNDTDAHAAPAPAPDRAADQWAAKIEAARKEAAERLKRPDDAPAAETPEGVWPLPEPPPKCAAASCRGCCRPVGSRQKRKPWPKPASPPAPRNGTCRRASRRWRSP